MTSEIVVMNQSAVAIAADSAVTIGDKTYNTANKLFMLSAQCPVGVMVYGNPQLMDVSWETIIKMYRFRSKKIRFPKLSDYAKDFVRFFDEKSDNFKKWFPELRQEDFFLSEVSEKFTEISNDIRENMDAALKAAFRDNDEYNDEQCQNLIVKVIEETIEEAYDEWDQCKYLDGYDYEFAKKICARYENKIKETIDEIFFDYLISEESKERLIKISGYMFTKDNFLPSHSGIVLVGYGEEDMFPSLFSLKFDRVVNNKLKYKKDRKIKIDCKTRREIVTFAENETIDTFLSGFDSVIQNALIDTLRRILFYDYPNLVVNELEELDLIKKEKIMRILRDKSEGPLNELISFINTYTTENSKPIHEAAEVIPKGDLAFMAETLINLTSFKRKYSMNQRETVAGPIDVAVISKGDGFIWIKRKHYFDSGLNPHYLTKHLDRKHEIVERNKE